tara:strand:- start:1508 stop:1789 length:282 start_codon:yes stop_codon:yes gene_type:complete
MMDRAQIIALSKQGFPIALAPAQMVAMMDEQQRLEDELAELKTIAANLATTGAMAVGALENGSPVSRVLVVAIKQYNEYAYQEAPAQSGFSVK